MGKNGRNGNTGGYDPYGNYDGQGGNYGNYPDNGYGSQNGGYNNNYSGQNNGYNNDYGGQNNGYSNGYSSQNGGYQNGYGGQDGGYNGGYGNGYGSQNGGYQNGYGGQDGGYNGGYDNSYGGQNSGYQNGYGGQNGGYDNGYGGQDRGYGGYGGNHVYGGSNGGPDNGRPGGNGGRKPSGKKKSRTADIISIVVMAVAFCVFVFAGYKLYGYYREYKKADEEYANLANYTTDEDESEDLDALEAALENEDTQVLTGREVKTVSVGEEEMDLPVMVNPIDFVSLKEENSDIVGWLKIRALDLSYPVVQGDDNDYYLHHSFEQEYLFAGCLFVNYENSSDFTDQNTIIYGHNMKNGSMFGTLKNLRDEEVFETSKYFWIFTENIIYQYRIFSVRQVNSVGQTYQTVFSDGEFQEFINTAMENSEVDNSTVSVTTSDKIVTLSTCTGDSSTRLVVQGKLVQMYASK